MELYEKLLNTWHKPMTTIPKFAEENPETNHQGEYQSFERKSLKYNGTLGSKVVFFEDLLIQESRLCKSSPHWFPRIVLITSVQILSEHQTEVTGREWKEISIMFLASSIVMWIMGRKNAHYDWVQVSLLEQFQYPNFRHVLKLFCVFLQTKNISQASSSSQRLITFSKIRITY